MEKGKVAFFWDESFLWAIIAYDVFCRLSINFDIVTAKNIQAGSLHDYDVVFVPGGWASNKSAALQEHGREELRDFVYRGGSYLGFCGGAGLALSHDNGLSLVSVSRKPKEERVPNFSGQISLNRDNAAHPMWLKVPEDTAFHAWWPGQFSISKDSGVRVLATYGTSFDGAYVSDVEITSSAGWDMLEERYGTNLNPERLRGEPAVLETQFGEGKIILSYLHFETPEDATGHQVVINLLEYLAGKNVTISGNQLNMQINSCENPATEDPTGIINVAQDLENLAGSLISYGIENSLWFWRNSWVLQWKRGIRGMEYCTLYILLKKLTSLVQEKSPALNPALLEELVSLTEFSMSFFKKAEILLSKERLEIERAPINPVTTDNKEIQALRDELFSPTKSFGGYYKQIIDRIDSILLRLLIANETSD